MNAPDPSIPAAYFQNVSTIVHLFLPLKIPSLLANTLIIVTIMFRNDIKKIQTIYIYPIEEGEAA